MVATPTRIWNEMYKDFTPHEHISGASKIPTVIYYDRSGKVGVADAVGAEAMIHERGYTRDG